MDKKDTCFFYILQVPFYRFLRKKYQKLIRETNIGSSSGVGVGFVVWYRAGVSVGRIGGAVGGVPGAGWKSIIRADKGKFISE